MDLVPGQTWDKAIRKAISESSYFIAVLSSRSVNRRGFVQREIRFALEIAEEYSEDRVFIIPVRIDECKPSFEGLNKLQRADLFPSYEDGIRQLLRTLKYEQEEKPALVLIDSEPWSGTIMKTVARGFGFIQYNVIRKELYFHSKELNNILFDELREGDSITFQIAVGPKGWVAVNVARV